jgi:3-oxoacyl-[acyl-carrier-protein] synthase-3
VVTARRTEENVQDVPIALDDAVEQGKIHPGDLVVFIGSGVGYNQAGAAFRMS